MMILVVLHDLPFNQNHPLKLADDWYLGTFEIEEKLRKSLVNLKKKLILYLVI